MQYKKDTISTMGAFFSAGGFSIKQYQKQLSIARNRILEGSRVVKIAQGPIEYSTAGKGLPVLFFHGAGGGHDMGRLFAGRIGDDFLWICPSRFGYLRTPIPQDASFESQADSYAALLAYRKSRHYWIIDWGPLGSTICFAASRPMCRISARISYQ
jgi:pimeloyl-ACP methyl ester carboxylesterase